MKTIQAVVPRQSRDEITFAVVEAQVADHFGDEQSSDVHALVGCLVQAVTDWRRQSKIGADVIQRNGSDFNVGDLAEWKDEESFVPHLRGHGIESISVETYSDSTGHSWEFDDQLIENFEII